MFWLADFLHRSPGELVRALHEQAKRRHETQDPIELCLDVGGWPEPKSLYFISDLILEGDHERSREVDLQSAVGIALDFYLNLRMAAAFALRAQRLAETRGLPTDGAIEAWALWEHGYSGPEDVPDRELDMIGKRIEELRALHSAGRQVLRAQEGKKRGAGRIRVPALILDAPPRPPEETGVRWGNGEPLQAQRLGSFFKAMLRPGRALSFEEGQIAAMLFKGTTTHLAAWLALPPEQIFEKIRQAVGKTPEIERALLGLDVVEEPLEDPIGAIVFEREGVFFAFVVGGSIAGGHAWEISQEEAVERIAEWKLRLRRAAVYAAWAESEAKRHGVSADDLIRLDAMAAYGFAEERGIPEEARGVIEGKRSELSELRRAGLFVLDVSKSLAETPR
ncbi:hypothetical protein [Thermoflexus sp.]|jgi:hypothetical protein|uniref:hypothetical protein n=1 Tax=Thermoflexus sp. TaxID=1969742 RepID=UPI003C02445B